MEPGLSWRRRPPRTCARWTCAAIRLKVGSQVTFCIVRGLVYIPPETRWWAAKPSRWKPSLRAAAGSLRYRVARRRVRGFRRRVVSGSQSTIEQSSEDGTHDPHENTARRAPSTPNPPTRDPGQDLQSLPRCLRGAPMRHGRLIARHRASWMEVGRVLEIRFRPMYTSCTP